MKKIILILGFLGFIVVGYSQTDTLYTKKQKKIACKITEINEVDIKYTMAENPNGPVYVISKATIYKYTLSNGYTELVIPDELSLENEHGDILKNRRAIKIHPFSLVNNQVSLAYENVIKVGVNLDVEVGYINNSINKNPIINNNPFLYNYNYNGYNLRRVFYTGGYIKPGIKFFLGQDYSVKGLKYAHPLKGRYIRLELAVSYLNFNNIIRYNYSYNGGYSQPTSTITTNINSIAYGGIVSYGRQFILGNILTFEYFLGVGFTGQSNSYTNADFRKTDPNNYNFNSYDNARNISNYHGFQRISGVGLSGSIGFRLGYILPEKKSKLKKDSK